MPSANKEIGIHCCHGALLATGRHHNKSSCASTREDVLQRTPQHMFLDDVRLESKACTIQANEEITVPVEVVWQTRRAC